ncbi:MAG: hypothetical protein Q4P15_06285 [Propionibacteriaceae bacterium]|nr:hypothetical protein [Propionibacteriaceae bacterium]
MSTRPLPPTADTIPGLVCPSAADARSYVGWRVDGFLYEWEKARGVERWLAFWLATQAMIQTFILVFVYAIFFTSPHRRYYMNEDRSAVVGIARRWGRWRIVDHAVAKPGTGTGQSLIETLRPVLVGEADRQQIPLEAFAASTLLADRYSAVLPGMTIVRRTLLRGLLMRREPDGPGAGVSRASA